MLQFYTCEDQRPWKTICTAWSVSNMFLCWSSEIGAWKGMARSKYWQLLQCNTGYYEQWVQATHQYLFSSGELDQGFFWEQWADWEGGRVIGLIKGALENLGKGRTTPSDCLLFIHYNHGPSDFGADKQRAVQGTVVLVSYYVLWWGGGLV